MAKSKKRKLPRYAVDEMRFEEDALGRRFAYTPEGRAVCGRAKKAANRKIENEACLGVPTMFGPCRVHGAKGGPPMRAGGRYSRVLKGLRRAYERALGDADLLDVRRDIAAMDLVIEGLVANAEQGDTPGWREELRRVYRALDKAIRGRKQDEIGQLMKQLGAQIEDGANASQVAKDLLVEVDRRASRAHRMNELEVRKLERVSVTEVVRIFEAWVLVLETHVDATTMGRLVPQLRSVVEQRGLLELEAGENGAD